MRTLGDQVIIVTGASGGLGAAAARELAGARAQIVATDIVVAGDELLDQWDARASFFCADLIQEDQVAALVAHTLARHGRLDGASNNAGVEKHGKPLTEPDTSPLPRHRRI